MNLYRLHADHGPLADLISFSCFITEIIVVLDLETLSCPIQSLRFFFLSSFLSSSVALLSLFSFSSGRALSFASCRPCFLRAYQNRRPCPNIEQLPPPSTTEPDVNFFPESFLPMLKKCQVEYSRNHNPHNEFRSLLSVRLQYCDEKEPDIPQGH